MSNLFVIYDVKKITSKTKHEGGSFKKKLEITTKDGERYSVWFDTDDPVSLNIEEG